MSGPSMHAVNKCPHSLPRAVNQSD
uniref:Uncharacterized protein n=1 Tax=Anguilla anguilla TaxID=7936 RepID=A0A0E9SXF4_ANGAN